MSATNPVSAPVATPPVASSSAVAESGGMWNEVTNCGANVLHLAYRVAGIVFVALQKVVDCILSLASSGFDKVHTWIIGVPSTASPESERAALEEAVRAADIEERLLGTAPPISTPSEAVSVSAANTVQQLPAVRQLNGLAAATAGLSVEEQYEMLQLQQLNSGTRTNVPSINHLTGGLSEADQLAALQQRTGGEPYVRPPMQFGGAQMHHNPGEGLSDEQQYDILQFQQVTQLEAREAQQQILAQEIARTLSTVQVPGTAQRIERDVAPLIVAAPRLQIPVELAALIPQNQDGVAFLLRCCPNLLNDSVEDVNTVLREAAAAVIHDCLDPTRPFPAQLPAFLLEPMTTIPNAAPFSEALEQFHRVWITQITGANTNATTYAALEALCPMSPALKGRVNGVVDRLMQKPAFQACVYGACDSE